MNTIAQLLPQNWNEAIGLTILHSLWQGLLVSLLAAATLYALRHFPARIRYRTALGAFLLIPLLAVITFFKVFQPAPEVTEITSLPQQQIHYLLLSNTIAPVAVAEETQPVYAAYLPYIAAAWIIGLLFFTLRFAGGFFGMQRLRFSARRRLPLSFTEMAEQWQKKLGIRRKIRLAESAAVHAPMLIGYFRPLILLPLGTVAALPQEQVMALLAHELAHVRRHDFIINLIQEIISVVFFYHPACWWLNQQIRNEREVCCDDQAIALGVDSIHLASALASVEERRQTAVQLALAANGGSLVSRIRTMLGKRSAPSRRERIAAVLFLLFGFIIITASSTMAQAREKENDFRNERSETGTEISDTLDYGGDTTRHKKKSAPQIVVLPGEQDGKPHIVIPGGANAYTVPDTLQGDIVIRRDKDGNVTSVLVDGKDYTGDVMNQLSKELAPLDYENLMKEYTPGVVVAPRIDMPRVIVKTPSPEYYRLSELDALSRSAELLQAKEMKEYYRALELAKLSQSKELEAYYLALELQNMQMMREGRDFKRSKKLSGRTLRKLERENFLRAPQPYVIVVPSAPRAPQPEELNVIAIPELRALQELEALNLDSLRSKLELQKMELENMKTKGLGTDFRAPLDEAERAGEFDKLNKNITEELIKDKVITDKNHYNFVLTKSSLKVNGKEQSAELHKKYMEMVKKVHGDLSEGSQFMINN